MSSLYYGFAGYILSGIPEPAHDTLLEINGYKIRKPNRLKNLAQERAFEIALVLAEKPSFWSGVTIITTSECVDIIMFNGVPEIQLKTDAVNPRVVAHKAMEFVPGFFEPGRVLLKKRKYGNRMWFLEIKRDLDFL